MKFWKIAAGAGVACAACCAAPIAGGVAALATGATSLAAAGAALLPCADELMPLALLLVVLATAFGIAAWLRRRRHRRQALAPSCQGDCNARC